MLTHRTQPRKFGCPYSTVTRPPGKELLVIREELYEEDFQDPLFIRPPAWERLFQHAKENRITAVEAAPGSGKSTAAAWIDWKLSQGNNLEYLSGVDFQKRDVPVLTAELSRLADETLVIVDDAHLVLRHLDNLMRSSVAPKLRFILFSRPGGLTNFPGVPPPIDISHAAESIANELARRYTSTAEEAAALTLESDKDLVLTKWLLGSMQQWTLRNPKLEETVILKLKHFWRTDKELLRLVLVLSSYRWLELPCSVQTLIGKFRFKSETIETLAETVREARLDRSTQTLELDRHAKLAGLFQATANKFEYYSADVLKPTCGAFGIDHSELESSCFGHVVLGFAVGSGSIRASDVTDRLMFSTLHSDCAKFCQTAASIESKLSPGIDELNAATVERRLTLAFAAYDAQRREADEEHAWRLLTELRGTMGVGAYPPAAFERNGYFLYQMGFHFLLINLLDEALRYFTLSAHADELWANTRHSDLHLGKAAMSRIAAARAKADVLLSTGDGPKDPKVETKHIGDLAAKLEAERILLKGLLPRLAGIELWWLQRWYLNALLHLAELRAVLGEEVSVEALIEEATLVGAAIRLDASTQQSVKLARGTLAFYKHRFGNVIDLLVDIPAEKQKAGERSGRFAQLLAIAYRELGNFEAYNRWCQWLANDCAVEKANGPAVAWAKAVLASPSPT